MKTAIVVGATGLVGSHIINQLLETLEYSKVKVFSRKALGINNPKLEEHLVNFNALNSWGHLILGDDLFSAMGTTLKVAGSKENQYKVDYTYPHQIAEQALKNGVKNYALVSAVGANAKSQMFYNRMKGELERDVEKLNFEKHVIVRPSFIKGQRKENRPAEKIGLIVFDALKYIPGLKKYRSTPAQDIAKCMIKAINDPNIKGLNMFEWTRIMEYANSI